MIDIALVQKTRARARNALRQAPARVAPPPAPERVEEARCPARVVAVRVEYDNADLPEQLDSASDAIQAAPEDAEPPVDEPEEQDLFALVDDEPPPFDPPDLSEAGGWLDDEDELLLGAANENECKSGHTPSHMSCADLGADQPVPPISIHVSWDRPESAELFSGFPSDRRMHRAAITMGRGGLDDAIARFSTEESPHLLILDTALTAAEMLAGLDRLAGVIGRKTKVIVISGVNDVGLLRALTARGVSEYMMLPIECGDVASRVCRMFGDADTSFESRVIAVIGARGGVGASTIAHNIAWSIAERQDIGATLLDLDLPFGTSASAFNQRAEHSLADALLAPERVESLVASPAQRLQLLPAPATLAREGELDPEMLQRVIARARRTSHFVVLDLPHAWNAWVKETLLTADDVVIVAGADLASLRNTKNMLDLLKDKRARAEPLVALSMLGAPKRPDIPVKEFAEAVGAAPIAQLTFDPALFGAAAGDGRMIGEIAPRSKAAIALDALATALTGHEPVKKKPPIEAAKVPAPARDGARPEHVQAGPQASIGEPNASANAPAEVKSEQAPLLLSTAAPEDDYITVARKRGEAELAALHGAPKRKSFGARRGLVRAAGLLALLLLGGMWWVQNRHEAASASEPSPSAAVEQPVVAAPEVSHDPTDQYARAAQLLDDGQSAEAVTLLRGLADNGAALAQYRLAKLYETGEGVAVDISAARQWTERAAVAGNIRAMHDLGVFFARGEGGPVDEAAAFRWFGQAAEFGVADSQFNLGVLYQQGRGVTANAEEALFWFLLAATQGKQDAAARTVTLEAELTPTQAGQAHARAEAFRPRLANAMANEVVVSPAATVEAPPSDEAEATEDS